MAEQRNLNEKKYSSSVSSFNIFMFGYSADMFDIYCKGLENATKFYMSWLESPILQNTMAISRNMIEIYFESMRPFFVPKNIAKKFS